MSRITPFLLTGGGRLYLQKEYVEKERSTYEIAMENKTYANAVRRALIFHGIPLRDKSEAQKSALSSGRAENPRQPNPRSEDER